jgi:hypothetical protein
VKLGNTTRKAGAVIIGGLVVGGIAGGLLSFAAHDSAPAHPASCLDQVRGWSAQSLVADNAMTTDAGTVSGDLNTVAADANAGNVTALHTDARSLQADVGTWQSDLVTMVSNLPPACAPGLYSSYKGAVTDYSSSAGALNWGATLLLSGKYAEGSTQFQRATVLIDQGNALIGTALHDLRARTGQG